MWEPIGPARARYRRLWVRHSARMEISTERVLIAVLTAALGGQTFYSKAERDQINDKASASCEDIQRLRDDIIEVLGDFEFQAGVDRRTIQGAKRTFERAKCG